MLTNAPRGTSRLIPVSASVVSKRTPTCLARMTDVTAVKVPPWRLAPNYITDVPCGGSHPGPGSLKLIARAFGSEAFAQTHHPDLHPGGSRPDPGPEVRSSSSPHRAGRRSTLHPGLHSGTAVHRHIVRAWCCLLKPRLGLWQTFGGSHQDRHPGLRAPASVYPVLP